MNGFTLLRSSSAVGLALLGGALFFAACGGKESGGPGSVVTTPVPLESYCDRLADELCNNVVPCCSARSLDAGTVAACRASYLPLCQRMVESEKRPGLAYDQALSTACMAELHTHASSCNFTGAYKIDCVHIFHGNVPLGGACGGSDQCIPPSEGAAVCASGKCIAPKISAAGGPCGWDGTDEVSCEIGLRCSAVVKMGTCLQPKGEGEACVGNAECLSDVCQVGKCTASNEFRVLCSEVKSGFAGVAPASSGG